IKLVCPDELLYHDNMAIETQALIRQPLMVTGSVLVTGGAGFIGSHLVQALVDAGDHVTVLDDLSAGSREDLRNVFDRLELRVAAVRDADAVARIVHECEPRYVFHLAANPSIPASVADPDWDYELNARGTLHVLEAVRHIPGMQRLVLASTGAVYGEPETVP